MPHCDFEKILMRNRESSPRRIFKKMFFIFIPPFLYIIFTVSMVLQSKQNMKKLILQYISHFRPVSEQNFDQNNFYCYFIKLFYFFPPSEDLSVV
jgi:hypothetical protein